VDRVTLSLDRSISTEYPANVLGFIKHQFKCPIRFFAGGMKVS
jgi:hypothetical protein